MTDITLVKKMLQNDGSTAAQVADALGVSLPTAYKYLKALRKKYGTAIVVRRKRVSARGPKSKVYAMKSPRRTR